MGNEFEFIVPLRDAIASTRALGPRIVAAGLIDGGGPNAFGVYYAATPEEAKQAVAKYHDAGFQQIKIYSLVDAADRRGDLRRGAPARHDRHRAHAERHDDRAGRGRGHGSHRAPRHSRRGRLATR